MNCPNCYSQHVIISESSEFRQCLTCGYSPSRVRITKHPSYREAIEYVALNDEPMEMDAIAMEGMPTVHLISVIFGTPCRVVAEDIVKFREKEKP